jgi:S-adenosylmethionine:tRNA-ribosyltransferase-isomerase (queuine synthetase)
MNERSASENRAFFDAFFNYSDIDKRYEKVRKVTTEKGFDFAFPSRSDQKHTVSVKSELLSLESYSKKIDDSHELFLNVVEVAIKANSVTTNQTLIIQTSLIKEKNKWLVDDVQVKGIG